MGEKRKAFMTQHNQVEQKRLHRVGLALTSISLVVIVMLVAIFFVLQRARTTDNERWCGLLTLLHEPARPATTTREKQINQELHNLWLSHGCDK